MSAAVEFSVLRKLFPYLWEYRGRVLLALALLTSAKLANISVPILMKTIVDGLSGPQAVAAVPIALLAAYGLLRLSSTVFNELRDIVFVKVAQSAMRRIALENNSRTNVGVRRSIRSSTVWPPPAGNRPSSGPMSASRAIGSTGKRRFHNERTAVRPSVRCRMRCAAAARS